MIHIAGGVLKVGSQLRQRCGWCGAVLIDVDLAAVMVPSGQEASDMGTFEPGVLVAVEGDNPVHQYVVEHRDGARLPPSACAQWPHGVTR